MLIEKFKKEGLALSKDALRQITGGYGTCGYKVSYNGTNYEICGVSQSTAQSYAGYYGGYWCCTSCSMNGGNSSYC